MSPFLFAAFRNPRRCKVRWTPSVTIITTSTNLVAVNADDNAAQPGHKRSLFFFCHEDCADTPGTY